MAWENAARILSEKQMTKLNIITISYIVFL